VPALLRDTVFRRYWSASSVSMLGDQVATIAVPLTAVIALHASTAVMGYLTALEWLPSLLFGLHAGAWADRRGRRRQLMIGCDAGRCALFATVPVCYAFGVLTLWQLFAVVFAAGTLSILFNVADSTLFVSIVAPERYVDGQSLIFGSRATSFLIGPAVGGLLAQLLTAPFAIVVDALSFLGSAFFLRRIDPPEPPPAPAGEGGVLDGVRFIARTPVVRASLIGLSVGNLFNLMYNTLLLLYAVRVLHVGAGLIGLILGCGAVGGLLGAALTKAIIARLGAGLAYVLSAFVFMAPLLLVPLAPVPTGHGTTPVVVLMLFGAEFLSAFGVMVLDPTILSIFAVVIPDNVRSRVMGAFTAINYGTRPVGALLGGLLGATAGLRPALWIAVAGGVLGAALLVPSPLPRFRLPA
jgi:MFS family permease